MNMRFCFKIDKEAKLTHDEEGNFGDTYTCVKVGVKKDPLDRKEYENLREGFQKLTASSLDVDISLVHPITLNQYLDATENLED